MKNVIICPKCKAEYTMSEIFLPKEFLGKSEIVSRDEENKIIFVTGKEEDLSETYKCDFCDTLFKVDTNIKFNTSVIE